MGAINSSPSGEKVGLLKKHGTVESANRFFPLPTEAFIWTGLVGAGVAVEPTALSTAVEGEDEEEDEDEV